MAVVFQELEGSPQLTFDRKGGSATRTLLIAWRDINRAVLELFPGALTGFPLTASYPGARWLRAQEVKIEPFDPQSPLGTGAINTYPGGAKLTISYAPNEWDDEDQEPPGDDDGEDLTFLTHRVTVGGEYLTWPNQGVRWEVGSGGQPSLANNDKRVGVMDNIQVGIICPTIEHEITHNYVARPSWRGIRACVGRVNKRTIFGAPPECLLYLGCNAQREFTSKGTTGWTLTHRFSEKNNGTADAPFGWNHFLRPKEDSAEFERLCKKKTDPSDPTAKEPIYPLINFRGIFGGPLT